MVKINHFLLFLFIVSKVSADLSPLFEYDGQTLIWCDEYDPVRYTECIQVGDTELVIDSSSQRHACTDDPSTYYSCESADDNGCQCNQHCTSWDTGWSGITFPALCLPVNFQLEDSWVNVSTYFLHDPGAGVPPQDPSEAPFPGLLIRFNATVWYGQLDLYHFGNNCTSRDITGDCILEREQMVSILDNICKGRNDQGCMSDMHMIRADLLPQRVIFREEDSGIFAMRTLTIIGSYAQIYAAMFALKYRPNPLENTNRLRSRLYNPGFSKLRPYETLDIQVDLGKPCPDLYNTSYCVFGPCVCIGNTLKGRLHLVCRLSHLHSECLPDRLSK